MLEFPKGMLLILERTGMLPHEAFKICYKTIKSLWNRNPPWCCKFLMRWFLLPCSLYRPSWAIPWKNNNEARIFLQVHQVVTQDPLRCGKPVWPWPLLRQEPKGMGNLTAAPPGILPSCSMTSQMRWGSNKHSLRVSKLLRHLFPQPAWQHWAAITA